MKLFIIQKLLTTAIYSFNLLACRPGNSRARVTCNLCQKQHIRLSTSQLPSHPRKVVIFLGAPCYRNRKNLCRVGTVVCLPVNLNACRHTKRTIDSASFEEESVLRPVNQVGATEFCEKRNWNFIVILICSRCLKCKSTFSCNTKTHCYNIDVLPLSRVVQFDLLLFSVFSMMMLVKKFVLFQKPVD